VLKALYSTSILSLMYEVSGEMAKSWQVIGKKRPKVGMGA